MSNTTNILSKGGYYVESLFSGFLSKLVIAVVILLVGFIIGKLFGRLVQKVLHEFELDRIVEKTGLKMTLESLIGTLVSFLIYFIAIIMALNQLGLTTIILYIILGGAILLILVSIILGVKDFIPNMIAGFFVHKKGLFKEGNKIKVKGVEGKIKKISLIETEVETAKKDLILIPNSLLVKTAVLIKRKKN
ncbi:mechanosensitive ion channel domain-containing protein [Nanoarchaeota archaeon]